MSHLLFWPTAIFFYPVGNTSAVCLTENLSPESKADILLLACGDPRHILYTIHANKTNPLTCLPTFDVTCCDVDVAVLARNTLLFTFLADDGVLDRLNDLWNLFYHMFVDKASLSMLFEQCRKLVGLSQSVQTWRAGPYGHFLTTCDARTLAELRRTWSTYLDTATLSSKQAKQFEQRFIDGMKKISQNVRSGTTTAARSAGPLALHVVQSTSRQFTSYWSSGTTDTQKSERRRLNVNPTFAFSIDGDKFAVHYGTDPLCGFHLAEAFASGNFTSPDERIPPDEVVRLAKEQFSRWCTSVSKRLKDSNPSSPTFVIRMFAGDVLTFCQALKYCEVTRSPVTPYNISAWRLSTITLDDHYYGGNAVSPAPVSFNVIDTSNILDHAGLVNILVVTAPLLQKSPSARLYTEALLRTGGDPSQVIFEHVCGDLPTMALLLGIIPSTFISQFITRSHGFENLMGTAQYYERLAWKPIEFSGPRACLSFLPKDLAHILFRTYLQMFSHEDMKNRFQQLLSLSPERTLQTLQHSAILHYNRRSFALLIHFVKTRIRTDWSRTMELFEHLVMTNTQLLTGQQAYQELCCHLHLLGVYTTEWISAPALRRQYLEFDAHDGLFHDWTQSRIPQVVTLVLVVPRDAIAKLERDFEDVGTPMLQCQMDDEPRQNWFAVTSATFGTLRVSGTGEHRTAVVIEGNAETGADAGAQAHTPAKQPLWRSGAPMIITFSVPSASVMDFGRNPMTTVGMGLCATPAVSSKFMNRLGLDLMVFRTKLTDAERVFVLTKTPLVDASAHPGTVTANHWQEDMRENIGSGQAVSGPGTSVDVQMNDTFSTIRSFTIRVDVTDPAAQSVLADTRTIPTVNSDSGSTSTDAYLSIGAHAFTLLFPLPVDVTRAKLRVARGSSYVEVIAPVSSFDVRPERDVSMRFALSSLNPNGDATPALGSIHYLNLDQCPALKLPKTQSELDWYYLHVGRMFSEFEKKRALSNQTERSIVSSSTSIPAPDTLLRIKQTLNHLLRSAAGATSDGKAPPKVFALYDMSRREEPYLYIIISRMRLDVGSHTVVADAFVAPGTTRVQEALAHMMPRDTSASTSKRGRTQNPDAAAVECLAIDADETSAWFHLLPRLVERCRTWTHKMSCTYRTTRRQEQSGDERALGIWEHQSPLCTCGEGVGTEVLSKAFERVAPYLTRAAFSPLFPVPYLKEVDASEGNSRMITRATEALNVPTRMATMPVRNDDTQDGRTETAAEYRCRSCGKEGSLACGRCKRARYCSKDCQRADWKAHKKDCGSAVNTVTRSNLA